MPSTLCSTHITASCEEKFQQCPVRCRLRLRPCRWPTYFNTLDTLDDKREIRSNLSNPRDVLPGEIGVDSREELLRG